MEVTLPGLDEEEALRCLAVLEKVVADRSLIARLPKELRTALVVAAGRFSRPQRHEVTAVSRALRKDRRAQKQALDRSSRADTDIRGSRLAAVFTAPPKLETPQGPERILNKPRACYVCKEGFTRLHFFYDSMCPACAELNYAKRFQTAPLSGMTAVITGARLKIGYQASLMMLRAGAAVVATTRFPHDAALRYSREADFSEWKSRLQVHGLDLRHSPSVEIFCRYLDSTLSGLHILINNAAQTVRRPPQFYGHLLEAEAGPLPEGAQDLLASHHRLLTTLDGAAVAHQSGASAAPDATGLAVWHGSGAGAGLRRSAELSQLKYGYDDSQNGLDAFPAGRTDADLQQVDLRTMNSWRMTLAEVPTAEMLELQLINAVAPFILCSKLKGLMLRSGTGNKHMVNVSAMEGSFSRGTKTDKHPHTNMAKAALNMLTLTSARDYSKAGIYMNAVDTGWVTDEDPAVHAEAKRSMHDFQPPLDIVDGAARILDPVFSGLLTGAPVWGKFLKDYKPTAW